MRLRTFALAAALALASTNEAGAQQPPSTTPLRLIGTAASPDSGGVAIIQRSDGAIQFLERADEVEGYTIAAILPALVVLRRAEEELLLELTGAAQAGDNVISLVCPPGSPPGSVWGTDVYTTDSSICTAAAHAGKITLERGGTVRYVLLPGRSSYDGTQRNGVTTSDWGEYESSFRFP